MYKSWTFLLYMPVNPCAMMIWKYWVEKNEDEGEEERLALKHGKPSCYFVLRCAWMNCPNLNLSTYSDPKDVTGYSPP